MITYWDSSALLSALHPADQHHGVSLKGLQGELNGVTSRHALMEVFSGLTGGKIRPALSANAAAAVIAALPTTLKIVDLDEKQSIQLLHDAQAAGVRGGRIYDFRHVRCAQLAGCDRVLSLDVNDLSRFGLKVEAP